MSGCIISYRSTATHPVCWRAGALPSSCRLISLSHPVAHSLRTPGSLFYNRHEMRTSAQKRWLILNRPNEIEDQSSLTRILPPAV